MPVNTTIHNEPDYYELQNVCEETNSVKDIGKCKYLFYKLKNNNYHRYYYIKTY